VTAGWRRPLQIILARVADVELLGEAEFGNAEVARWPRHMVAALAEAGLIAPMPPADAIICMHCEERCLRPVLTATAEGRSGWYLYSTCDLKSGMGPFERSSAELQRWTGNRRRVAEFFGRALGLEIKGCDENWRNIRYRTFRVETSRYALRLEFRGTAMVLVGSVSVPLLDALDWEEERISVDRDALVAAAGRSDEMQAGGTSYQPSTIVREDRRAATVLRDRRLQRSMNVLAREHPTLNKEQLAKKLVQSKQNEGITASRILRVTRRRAKKGGRKNFA
jgi:hypothetical protein